MASGKLGSSELVTGTNTIAYTVPADTFTVASVSFCNKGNSAVSVRLALADADTPTDAEYLEYDVELQSKMVLERTGIVLSATQKIVAYATSANVSVVAFGIETPTA